MAVYRRKDTKSKRWFYKFEVDGVTYKKGIPTARTKHQAEEAERQAIRDVHDGRYDGARHRSNMLLGDFIRQIYLPWAKQHHAPSGNDRRAGQLFSEYFKGRSLAQISLIAIEGFKQQRARTLTQYDAPFKPGTINLELNTLSGILTLAVKHGYIRGNPCRYVKRLPMPEAACRYLSPAEETALLGEATRDRTFLKPLIQVALSTGFRQCELVALEKSSINFERNLIFVVNPKWRNDPRRTRGNPMNAETREILMQLARTSPSNRVFLNDHDNTPLTSGVIDSAFRRVCRRAKVFDFRFHDLRHTFGTRLGDANVGLEKIARLMGHANIKMTMRYVHPTEDGLQRAIESTRIVPGESRAGGLEERKLLQAIG